VESNSKFVRGKQKVQRLIEDVILPRDARQIEQKGWAYILALPHQADEAPDHAIGELLHAIACYADPLVGTNTSARTQSYAYNGDGTLVSATANGASASYAQDLAGGMSQILASTSGGITSDYLRDDGAALIASLTGGVRSWYGSDNQGSVRQVLDDSGAVLDTQSYDPCRQLTCRRQ